jgi:membrane-bound serine protease (ClpP class)
VIALSAHVAAMAPGTNIGAATPVDLQGGEIGDKVVNDAAAYVRALAELRGRDPDFYEDTVREGRSEPASRALEIGAIDLIATDRDELFREVDEIPAGAVLVPHDLGFLRSVRQRLADPNIAFLFLSLGTLAIIYELANPGIGFGGIAGVIMIVLAFFSLAVLPVNVVGLVFLLLAVGLFVAELFVPGVGVFAGGGAVSLVLAGLFLFRGSIGVDLIVILPTVAVLGGGTILAGRLVWRARRAPSGTGTGMVAGRVTQVKQADGARGQVVIDGTWWRVRSTGVPLEAGQTVVVREMDGLELVVEPRTEEESA